MIWKSWRREPAPDWDFIRRYEITHLPLEALLARADFISLHVPLTDQTRHLINQRTLALMKPSALLVNTARGGVVCEPDLLRSLEAGRIAGAALDVFAEEPAINHPLFRLENVIVTPHTAGGDLRSRSDMALSAAEAILSLQRGVWPAEKVVNPEVRDRFRW